MQTASDVDARHTREATALAHTLEKMKGCARTMTNFIDRTYLRCAYGNGAVTSIEDVHATSIALMAALNAPKGASTIGFDVGGTLPFCMVVANIFGQEMAFHSSGIALVRELCGSAYGAIDRNCSSGCILRNAVDDMAERAYSERASLCLVYSVPWGSSVQDRFWKLFTIRNEADRFVDSELALSSTSVPPAAPGMPVAFAEVDATQSAAALERIRNTWHSRCIDEETDVPSRPASPDAADASGDAGALNANHTHTTNSPAEQRLLVCTDLIKRLQQRDRETQARMDKMQRDAEATIQSRVAEHIERVNQEQAAESMAIGAELLRSQEGVQRLRAQADSMMRELFNVDRVQLPEARAIYERQAEAHAEETKRHMDQIRELSGQLLAVEEDGKKGAAREKERRKNDNRLKLERAKADAAIEEQAGELSTLRVQLKEQTRRTEEAKREAAEQLAAAMDAKADALNAATAHKAEMNTQRHAHEEALQELRDNLMSAQDALVDAQKNANDVTEQNDDAKRALSDAKRKVRDLSKKNETLRHAVVAAKSERRRAARLHLLASGRAFLLATRLRHTTSAEAVEKASTASTSPSPQTGNENLWNAVATAKSLIATAQKFVETAQNGGSATNGQISGNQDTHTGYPEHYYQPFFYPDPNQTLHQFHVQPPPMHAAPMAYSQQTRPPVPVPVPVPVPQHRRPRHR